MDRIEIDTQLLHSDIDRIKQLLNSLKRTVSNAYEEAAVLDSMWDGLANSAYIRTFNQDQERLIELCSDIEAFAERLNDAKEQYETGEACVSDIIAALDI